MKKKKSILPAVLSIAALAVIAGVGVIVLSRFTSTGKRMQPYSYYGLESSDEAALIVNDRVLDAKGIVRDGRIYLNYKTVWDYIDCGYYWEASKGQLLQTLPAGTKTWAPEDGTGDLILDGEQQLWISADLILENSDLEMEILTDPGRLVVRTRFENLTTCIATKKAPVRYRGGRKSEVLTELAAGDTVVLLDTVDDWSHVSTADGYIGYVKSDMITQTESSAITHESDPATVFPKVQVEGPVVMGWHYTDSEANNQYLKDMIQGTTGMNTISPTWFSLADAAGTVTSYASADYVAEAHQAGLRVWGMFGDVNGTPVDTGETLESGAVRGFIIDQLLTIAADTGMDGINIDLESITEANAPQYLQFLKELSLAAHEKGLTISVDNFVPTYTWYYRRREQAKCVDYVVIMGYDEHTKSSEEIGSVASIGFVEAGITDTLKEVPASSVINAVPFYGRCWVERYGTSAPDTTALSMEAQQDFITEHGIVPEWDGSVAQYVGVSEDGEARYSIWMEDSESMTRKLELINSYELAGVACWRLGLETPDIWDVISSAMNG